MVTLEQEFARDVYVKIVQDKRYMEISTSFATYSRYLDILVSLKIPYDVDLWEKTYNIYGSWEDSL